MKNSNSYNQTTNSNHDDMSNSANSKFIRKSNSQAFNSYQNMLKYKANTDIQESNHSPPKKLPLERKNTIEKNKPKSIEKAGTKV